MTIARATMTMTILPPRNLAPPTTSRLSSAATKHCESPPLKLAQADDTVGFAMAMRESPALSLNASLDEKL